MSHDGEAADTTERTRQEKFIWAYFLVAVIFWVANTKAFVSEDNYFYLVIARNIALFGEQTFNRIVSTNGAHPLWLYIVTAYSFIVSLIDRDLLYSVRFALILPVLFTGIGARNFIKVSNRLGFSPMVFVLPPLGFVTIFGFVYSEAHVLYMSVSMLMLLSLDIRDKGTGHFLLIGLVSSMVFLARLDSIFVVMAYYVWLLWRTKKLKLVIFSGTLFTLISGAYVLSNVVYFGGPVPVSGWLKSSFPDLYITGLSFQGKYTISLSSYHVQFGIAPLVFSLFIAAFSKKEIYDDRTIMYPFLGGLTLHFLQIALFSRQFTLWYWYYIIPAILGAFSAAILSEFVKDQKRRALRYFPKVIVALTILFTATVLILDKTQELKEPCTDMLVEYFNENKIENKTVFLAEFPGSLAFYTDNRYLAADMLTTNIEFVKEMKKSKNAVDFIFDFCRSQGKPVRYVAANRGPWLVPSRDLEYILYFDPKSTPDKIRIGYRRVRNPNVLRMEPSRIIIWEFPQSGPRPEKRNKIN